MEKPNPFKILSTLINNRLIALFVVSGLSFMYLSIVLFDLQIVQGYQVYERLTSRGTPETFYITPERGHIYDRFGRPLAVNIATHSVIMDPIIVLPNAEANQVIFNLVQLLERNGEAFFDVLPITDTFPFEFTFTSSAQRARFFRELEIQDTRVYAENGGIEIYGFTAQDVINILAERFVISELEEEHDLTREQVRSIISLRHNLWNHRWTREEFTVALDIGMDTITSIQEDPQAFRSLSITTEFLRYYPAGRYLSHIVGYIGNIRDTHDIEDLMARGYNMTDRIGIAGIESQFEEELRGHSGSQSIYMSGSGRNSRRLGIVEGSRVEPVRGSDIFLTLDLYLQKEAFHYLENVLTNAIVARMIGNTASNERNLTVQEVLASLVAANNLDPRPIFDAEGGASLAIATYVNNYVHQAHLESINEETGEYTQPPRRDPLFLADRLVINRIISNAVTNNYITPNQILLAMYEQDMIYGEGNFAHRIATGGAYVARNIVVDLLREGQITPQMTNVDPSTGSLVLVDVHTGEVLASVAYPSFDTNQLVNNVNGEYLVRLFNDPTTPLVNRPFMERRAPGSTFKMLTGIAGLEYGVITPNTRILDRPVFTAAGWPYATSWASGSLGNLNYAEAVAISSNYFFYEVAFRLGVAPVGGRSAQQGIQRLNTFMRAFGFDSETGVEIGESPSQMSSPDLMYRLEDRHWADGDTIRTAIGQSLNSYTSATMARFTAGLATRGEMVYLRMLNRIVSPDGVYVARTMPFDMGVEISDSTWDATHQGMRFVTEAPATGSTANHLFNAFPFSVGSKTGTAEEIRTRPSHTTFNAFAPWDNPQVAIHVTIPFGALSPTMMSPSASAQVARGVLGSYFQFNREQHTAPNTSAVLLH